MRKLFSFLACLLLTQSPFAWANTTPRVCAPVSQTTDDSSWVEVSPPSSGFSIRFPSEPKHTSIKSRVDGHRWEYLFVVLKERNLSLDVSFRPRKSDEFKWSHIDFNDVRRSFEKDKDVSRESVCLLHGYAAIEELRRGLAGFYYRELRVFTERHFYTLSVSARNPADLESAEVERFLHSFQLKAEGTD